MTNDWDSYEYADAEKWNSGACDLIAVALNRLYGLPMRGEFEYLGGGATGYLLHAWCVLPDGRAIDARGVFTEPTSDPDYRETHDPSVQGTIVLDTHESDPRLVEAREVDYDVDVDAMGAPKWVLTHLGEFLAKLGVPFRDDAIPSVVKVVLEHARKSGIVVPEDAVETLMEICDNSSLSQILNHVNALKNGINSDNTPREFNEILRIHGFMEYKTNNI